LFADLSGGQNFILQGTASDPGMLTGTYFGILNVYTSSNANKFFYDDIYIGNEIIDNQPPVLTSAAAVSSTQLDVLFNESLDPTSAQNVLNYSLNPTVSLSSNLNQKASLPISLMITNSSIPIDSPLITYDDTTGVPEFYSYFASSRNIDGTLNSGNTKQLPP